MEALGCADMGQHREQVLLVQGLGAPAHATGVPGCADGVRCAALNLSTNRPAQAGQPKTGLGQQVAGSLSVSALHGVVRTWTAVLWKMTVI